ncbi:RNA polymerase sigma factor [Virgisporangium ochraceum]|uniref:DNA-directed RNA polymerase sigma-70 factor n=1 Tax=Virgisporangium ochraceum TaxID=65505 RepID=A0A8J4A4J0_9ACTN|nr:sigma-70 family RNA polymerase sigma factor [Virgisporangium ochraceum]GIJ75001.1 DNA-directed RNA polymerase sigma-70 factor [Virgisporangium ochraceum]
MARAAPPTGDAAARFERLYRHCYQDLLGFALRRTDRPEAAADVVADTFVVAWRRIEQIPSDHPRAWLFGVARNVMAGHERTDRRQARLAARLRQDLSEIDSDVEPVEVGGSIGPAFRALPESDRDLLRLVAWEGLTAEELAVTLGCSANAARIRLHRARRRFAAALSEHSVDQPGVTT